MPSKHTPEKPGFFRKQLEDGTKSFRYRPGIRTLLGRAESQTESLCFARPLPRMNLSSLNPRLPKIAESAQGFPLANKNTLSHKRASPQKVEQKRNIRLNKTSEPTATHKQSEAVFKKTETHKQENLSPQAHEKSQHFFPPMPNGDDKKNTDSDGFSRDFTEETQVDIPGFSKNKSSFLALIPFASEVMETGGDNKKQPAQENPKEQTTKKADPQDQSLQSFASPLKDNQAIKSPQRSHNLHRAPTRQNSILDKTEPGEAFPTRQQGSEAKTSGNIAIFPVLTTETQAKQKPLIPLPPKKNEVEADKKNQSPQNFASPLRDDQASRGRATPSVLHTETHRQQWPAIKHKSKEDNATRNTQKTSPEEIEPALKTHAPQTAPIVIVKQAQPQNKTPPAFWERRYLSHAALKLRILR
ncbi:MAG: hypothetical protein VST69_08305 [Nitrospirota bacterium]|nr:hypothetical protein [Nitrospirota bacterium]